MLRGWHGHWDGDRTEKRAGNGTGTDIGFGSQAGTEARDNINEEWRAGQGDRSTRLRAMGRATKADVSGLRAEATAAWGSRRASACGGDV